MHYTFFEFENYKGIRKTRLDLGPSSSAARVHALVGLNESGKTTLLEAIDHFRAHDDDDVIPKQLAGWQPPDPQTLIPVAERSNFNGTIVIRAGVVLDDDDYDALRAHLAESEGYRLVSLNREITIDDRYEFENSKLVRRRSTWSQLVGQGKKRTGKVLRPMTFGSDRDRWLQAAAFLRRRLPTAWYFPNFLFDFPDKIYLEETHDESHANRFFRNLFQDILNVLGRDHAIGPHIVDRARSGDSADLENLQQVLLEVGRHVTTTIVGAWNEIFGDRPLSDKRIRIDWGDEDGARFWVRFRLEDADGLFAVSERSVGFRWFFVYLMLTTYRGQREGVAGKLFFLFDEPASNLHPAAQSALLASLDALSERAVIVYTTHSHHLINPAWLSNTSVVSNVSQVPGEISADVGAERTDVHVKSYRQFVGSSPNQSRYFQPILDVLDYAPSAIELVPDVAMVEGKSDFYLLTYFQTIVQRLGPAERLALLPGGGAGSLDAAIQLYMAWNRNFVVLLDSDRAGRSESQRYRSKFGALLEPRILLLSEASGVAQAKGIESLLTQDDKLALQRVADPSATKYSKKAFGLGVQEALVSRTNVAISSETTNTLANLISSLRARLN